MADSAGRNHALAMATLFERRVRSGTRRIFALIIALVAIGLIAILLVLRNSIGDVFNNASEALVNAPTNPYP